MNNDFIPGLAIGFYGTLLLLSVPIAWDRNGYFIEKRTINQSKPCTQVELIEINSKTWVCDSKEWRLVK